MQFVPIFSVKAYNPDKYEKMYDNAKGDTEEEKLNYMRRKAYAANKERINEQKRTAYEKRKELESPEAEEINVN